MANGGGDEQKLFWVRLPEWAEDFSHEGPFPVTQAMVDRSKIHLTPYDPNNKEKGRQIIIIDDEEEEENRKGVVCMVCDAVNEHYSYLCPKGSLEEHLLSKGFEMYCETCRKKDHFSYKCPDDPWPDRPIVRARFCKDCGPEVCRHFAVDCPKLNPSIEYDDCYICKTTGEHDTEECPTLITTGKKFCFSCMAVTDHTGEACPNAKITTDDEIEVEGKHYPHGPAMHEQVFY